MTEEEIRIQISEKQDDITRIEEDAAKKEAGAEKRIEADWDNQINETKAKLDTTEIDLKEAKEKADEWVTKRDKLTKEFDSLSNKHEELKKGKDKALRNLLRDIASDKTTKIKVIQKDVKKLEKKLKKLEEEKLKQQES